MTLPCYTGPKSSRAGPLVGGAGVPVRQVRGVRQRHTDNDDTSDTMLEGGSFQGYHHQSCQHRALLQRYN